MGKDAEAVIAAGLALDEDERAVVAQRLLESLHAEDNTDEGDVDGAWRHEIDTRVDDILNGKVELIPWEQTRAKGRALLDELRNK